MEDHWETWAETCETLKNRKEAQDNIKITLRPGRHLKKLGQHRRDTRSYRRDMGERPGTLQCHEEKLEDTKEPDSGSWRHKRYVEIQIWQNVITCGHGHGETKGDIDVGRHRNDLWRYGKY